MIEEGMVINNGEGAEATLTSVVEGTYGLLLKGVMDDGFSFTTYCPFELPAVENTWPDKFSWYGWAGRGHIVLPSGLKLGDVCFRRSDERPRTIEEHDAEWERTEIAMRKEEQECELPAQGNDGTKEVS